MVWLVIIVLSIAVLPADFVIAAMFPNKIAPWIFVVMAFGFPAFFCGYALSRS
jgi:hypothetical protein